MSINRAILLGNVGKDPEIRATTSGDRVAGFSLATSESWRDKATGERKETTEWHEIVVFNQALIPVIEQWVKKGGRVAIEGMIKTREWEDAQTGQKRRRTEIVIGRFDGKLTLEGQPAGARRDEHAYGQTTAKPPASDGYGAAKAGASPPPRASSLDDDIPF